MYEYRRMTREEQEAALLDRRELGYPLHAPPRSQGTGGIFLITAACFEHRHFFDDPALLSWLSEEVQGVVVGAGANLMAWVFLPNHYHVEVGIEDVACLSEPIRKVHARLAKDLNAQHGCKGRQVWHSFSDRHMRTERHMWTTLTYLHMNPVRHGYVDLPWQWPWSSVHPYRSEYGDAWLAELAERHALAEYGKGWDW
jgi:putative transposase